MKVLLQRTLKAAVVVDNETVGAIDHGLLLLIGFCKTDNDEILQRIAKKVLAYRIFSDEQGKMNLNVQEVNGGVLAVSQFTLSAETGKGLRPGFSSAAPPETAKELYLKFVEQLKTHHTAVETGRFGANMQVSLVNDGPVTFLLEL